MAAKRRTFSRTLRYALHRLFPRHETAGAVGLSVAIGIWIAVLPTLGIALPLTALAAHATRVPKGPALLSSFVATPPTLFFIFYPLAYFQVGLPLLKPPQLSFDFMAEVRTLTLVNATDVAARLWHDARGHVIAFLLGTLVVATITAALGYALSYVIMERKLERRRARRALKQATY